MTMSEAEVTRALDAARELTACGIPVFAAPPAPGTKIGFRLPDGWQRTKPDTRRIDEWIPGWALCMVCGCGLDVIDIDIYAGGMLDPLLDIGLPRVWRKAMTPSGGIHLFIRSLGERSKNGFRPGTDLKCGDTAGTGRGFVFLAPTVKPSKITGELLSYTWAD